MLAISMRLAIALRALLQYAPTNALLRRLRSRDGLKWGPPFMLLGVAYLLAATLLAHLLNDGGPGWLNLLVILGIGNGLRFIIFGPISMILLVRARLTEHRQKNERIATEGRISNFARKQTSPDRSRHAPLPPALDSASAEPI